MKWKVLAGELLFECYDGLSSFHQRGPERVKVLESKFVAHFKGLWDSVHQVTHLVTVIGGREYTLVRVY